MQSEIEENASSFNEIGEEIGEVYTQKKQMQAKSLGFLIMGPKTFYTDNPNENENKHLPYKEEFPKLLEIFIKQKFNVPNIRQITCGHEHGTTNKKCHYQICVEFETICRNTIKPFEMLVDEDRFTFLGMCQKAKNIYALKNYCRKDRDFVYLHPELVIKEYTKTNKKGEKIADPYTTILMNREKFADIGEAMDHILFKDTRNVINNYRNVEYALTNILKPQICEFKWTFPDFVGVKYPAIQRWFFEQCFPEDLPRRKALMLYSSKRAMGKTQFAQRLVPHESYYIIFRNTFTKEALEGKENARLLILDDMSHYTRDNKETWKALVASEETSIRDCYTNFLFNRKLPCIITSNNFAMFSNFMIDSDFNTQVYFVEIEEYIGPDGTEIKDLGQTHFYVSERTLQEVEKKKEERLKFKEMRKEFKNENYNGFK